MFNTIKRACCAHSSHSSIAASISHSSIAGSTQSQVSTSCSAHPVPSSLSQHDAKQDGTGGGPSSGSGQSSPSGSGPCPGSGSSWGPSHSSENCSCKQHTHKSNNPHPCSPPLPHIYPTVPKSSQSCLAVRFLRQEIEKGLEAGTLVGRLA